MPREIYDLKPVTHITSDAIGPPGNRTFLLQASQGDMLVTVVLEKEQVHALSLSVDQMLEELEKRRPQSVGEMDLVSQYDMVLKEPVEPIFRVGQLGLGYDERDDLLIIVAQELTEDDEEMSIVRFWGTRAQMKALSEHSMQVVEAGRPICPLCGAPIDPDGHYCPRRNGHQ
jgi:uncharacterized repeat protein (TIGR03847 family)